MKNGMSFDEAKMDASNKITKKKSIGKSSNRGTIAIDFDNCIHTYEHGWGNGSIYGRLVEGSVAAITALLREGYSVIIMSARSSTQIVSWFDCLGDAITFDYRRVPDGTRFWNFKNVVGVTNIKLPANVYIDDRAVCFKGSWGETLMEVSDFKVYNEIVTFPKPIIEPSKDYRV